MANPAASILPRKYLLDNISKQHNPTPMQFPRIYPIYVFTACCFFIIATYIYIYLTCPFWCRQPVVHTYDWWRRWLAPGPAHIIRSIKSPPTKFYFPEKTYTFNPLDQDTATTGLLTKCTTLLQNHYISADNVLFSIQPQYLAAHCIGHGKMPPLISLYYETSTDDPQAMLAAFPAEVYTTTLSVPQSTYFWNYICVQREYQTKSLTRPLIQTHEYRQRVHAETSFFRCDTDLPTGIVPVARGYTYTYYLRCGNVKTPRVSVVRIHAKSSELMGLFTEYMKSSAHKPFTVYMAPSLENMIALIDAGIWYVYAMVESSAITALYFFKNVCTTYEDLDGDVPAKQRTFTGSRTIHCFGSISSIQNTELFGSGFVNAVKRIVKASRGQFNVLLLDDAACNGDGIIPVWNRAFTPFFTNEYAYYAYNWRIPGMPLYPQQCMFCL
jgi:hypothetical protein